MYLSGNLKKYLNKSDIIESTPKRIKIEPKKTHNKDHKVYGMIKKSEDKADGSVETISDTVQKGNIVKQNFNSKEINIPEKAVDVYDFIE